MRVMRLVLTRAPVCLALRACAADDRPDPFADPLGATSSGTTAVDDTFEVNKDPSGAVYFPLGREAYYTKYLAAMNEPSLFRRAKARPDFELRFTWLRTFHESQAVDWQIPSNQFRIRDLRNNHAVGKKSCFAIPSPLSESISRGAAPLQVGRSTHRLAQLSDHSMTRAVASDADTGRTVRRTPRWRQSRPRRKSTICASVGAAPHPVSSISAARVRRKRLVISTRISAGCSSLGSKATRKPSGSGRVAILRVSRTGGSGLRAGSPELSVGMAQAG